MIRAVLDTNVVISALLFSGPPSQLVSAWQSSRFRPVVSAPVLDEYIQVLAYPKFKLSDAEIRNLVEEELLPFIETVKVPPLIAPKVRDPDDAKFITCAGNRRRPLARQRRRRSPEPSSSQIGRDPLRHCIPTTPQAQDLDSGWRIAREKSIWSIACRRETGLSLFPLYAIRYQLLLPAIGHKPYALRFRVATPALCLPLGAK